jgi:hypothetical protein
MPRERRAQLRGSEILALASMGRRRRYARGGHRGRAALLRGAGVRSNRRACPTKVARSGGPVPGGDVRCRGAGLSPRCPSRRALPDARYRLSAQPDEALCRSGCAVRWLERDGRAREPRAALDSPPVVAAAIVVELVAYYAAYVLSLALALTRRSRPIGRSSLPSFCGGSTPPNRAFRPPRRRTGCNG